jgi:predicted small secreted protein
MKLLKSVIIGAVVAVSAVLSGCGTVGGAVQGAGEDLSRAGEWIRNR